MTDKSFGDHTTRNSVRNPLLSTAVVGLSLEDLTHNAVLLPAAQNSALICSQETEQTMQPATDRGQPPDVTDRNTDRTDNKTDDFDVNEYIARLQGSRYVSAPINATLDTNMNETGLEEINLNEIQEEQSLTADIAQNFSQLPAVLPQVASAVFSSLSNMMRAKSREHTPEYFEGYDKDVGPVEVPSRVHEVGPQIMQGMPPMVNPPKMEAPPLKEPPLGSTVSTFRMTSKKKTYAQIPGLTNNSTVFMQDSVPRQSDSISYFTPNFNQNTSIGESQNENTSNIPSDIAPKSFQANMSAAINMFDAPQAMPRDEALKNQSSNLYPLTPSVQDTFKAEYQMQTGMVPSSQTDQRVLVSDTAKTEEVPLMVPGPVGQRPQMDRIPQTGHGPVVGQIPLMAQGVQMGQGPQVGQNAQTGQLPQMGHGPQKGQTPVPDTFKAPEYHIPPENPVSIIPPPTMFSNPSRNDSKEVERTILPPSVARRLAGQSKGPTTPIFEANIFVPGPISDNSDVQNKVPGAINFHSGERQPITEDKSAVPPPMLFTPASAPNVAFTPQSLGQPPNSQSVPSISQPPPVNLTSQVYSPPQSSISQPPPISQPMTSINPTNQFFNTSIGQPPSSGIQPPSIATFNPNVGTPSATSQPPINSSNQAFNPTVNQPLSSISQPPINPLNSIFNPLPSSISQPMTENEPPKVPEPPKITTGNVNYRLTKKRPQYYSGPIEGIGAISNNVKPVIAHIFGQGNQAQLFTPAKVEEQAPLEAPTFDLNQANSAIPFDLNKAQNYPSVPYDLNQAQNYTTQGFDFNKTENYPQIQPDIWDLSRQTTDNFEPPKQESGFGLIGSLKSKLGSIDINKIQNKVTTFFDPAYNNAAKTQEEYQGYTGEQRNLDLFVVPQHSNDNQNPQAQNYYNPNQYYEQYNQQSYYQNPASITQSPFVQSENTQIQTESFTQNSGQPWPQNTSYTSQYQYQYQPEIKPDQSTYYQPEIRNVEHSNQSIYQFHTEVKEEQNIPELKENHISKSTTADIHHPEPAFDKAKEDIKETEEGSILEGSQNVEEMTKPNIPPIGVPMFAGLSKNIFDQPIADVQNKVNTVENTNVEESQNDEMPKLGVPMYSSPVESFFDQQTSQNTVINDENTILRGSQDDEMYKPIGIPMFSNPVENLFDQPSCEIASNILQDIPRDTNIASAFKNTHKAESDFAFKSAPLQPPESFFDLPQQLQTGAFKGSEVKEEVEKSHKNDAIKSPEKLQMGISPSGFFVKCLEPDVTAANFFENPQASQHYAQNIFPKDIKEKIQEEIPSLPSEVLDSIATSNVIRDIAKELVLERRASKDNIGFVPYKPTEIGASKEMDKDGMVLENPVHIFTTNQSFIDNGSEMYFVQKSIAQNYHEHESDLNICETCREVNESPVGEATNLTQMLIENITSPIQLSNPVEVPLTESSFPVEDMSDVTNNVCAEITHITEETIETLQVQSATELLDDEIIENFDKNLKINSDLAQDYGWTNPEAQQHYEPNYGFPTDANTVGFYSTNSIFFDDIPRNASDEIKAEFKSVQESPVLTRQMSIPTAPPAEDEDDKSDGTGLDVTSIEQDANKDFPIYEDYVIEPSETDDDKIVRDRSSEDPIPDVDSFTNRVEKYKQLEENEVKTFETPALTVASYFDTGNYAVESHYQKTQIKTKITPQYSTLANLVANSEAAFASEVETNKTISDNVTDIHNPKDVFEGVTQFPDIIKDTKMCGDGTPKADVSMFGDIKTESIGEKCGDFGDVEKVTNSEALPDPMDFFGSKAEPKQEDGFNRLASYFASPKKTEQSKPFFELSQGQDHLRKGSNSFLDKTQNENHYKKDIPLDLMKDLTSIDNYTPNRDQVIKHVNYFTVHYNNPITKQLYNREAKETNAKVNLEYIDARVNINNQEIKVRKAMDSDNGKPESPSQSQKESPSKQCVSFNVPLEKEKEENQALITNDQIQQSSSRETHHKLKSRPSGEYTPVKHHWFYRVDCEGRSIWKGFSNVDSNALEDAFNSPNLSEDTLVATDGGRFDVNVMGRLRIPVYWPEKPTNVKRCSWFYKGTTDARYVPYAEDIANRLEEEYRLGVTQGAWHRRLSLPNDEAVILHTPAVMVHVLQSPNLDAWGGTRILLWSKKVYRNPLKIKFAKDQNQKIDHLLLLVHGAGEWRHQKLKIQSTMRPRVVRRGHDDSEIEDTEPSSIDHLLLLCHGVGSACDMRFRAVEEVVDDFRATSLQLIQGHYKNAYENGEIGRIEVLPVSWHATLHAGEHGVDKRLATITLDSIPRLRTFTNESVLDILFYTSPVYCQTIIDTVCSEVNRIYNLFKQRNPGFKGGVSLGGHSLGSVILYDLLCHQTPEKPVHPNTCTKKQVVNFPTPQPNVAYPTLEFSPEALYALGSPVAMFECTRGVEALGEQFALPTCRHFFNIFHPYDPIAYRIEPLINPDLKDVSPFLIPHHKGRKRMHLELKETMARVGADIKQKLFESIKATWAGMWRSPPPNTEMLEKVVEEEIEKEVEKEENEAQQEEARAQPQDLDQKTLAKMGKLNGGRRIDYVLQEAPFEMINEYLFAISSHVGYWESEDTMLLILREIYDALGVAPDGRAPLHTMTVLREEEVMFNTTDEPSTSHS